jgi:hypothetical protein
MYHESEKRGGRDYFWFALVLIVVLMGSAFHAASSHSPLVDPFASPR